MKHLTPILTNALVVGVFFALVVLAFKKLPGLANQDNSSVLVGIGLVLALALVISSVIRVRGDDRPR